jgi:hypothetical protein
MQELTDDERSSVIAHLRRMAAEPGWSTGQKLRARVALDSLENDVSNNDQP